MGLVLSPAKGHYSTPYWEMAHRPATAPSHFEMTGPEHTNTFRQQSHKKNAKPKAPDKPPLIRLTPTQADILQITPLDITDKADTQKPEEPRTHSRFSQFVEAQLKALHSKTDSKFYTATDKDKTDTTSQALNQKPSSEGLSKEGLSKTEKVSKKTAPPKIRTKEKQAISKAVQSLQETVQRLIPIRQKKALQAQLLEQKIPSHFLDKPLLVLDGDHHSNILYGDDQNRPYILATIYATDLDSNESALELIASSILSLAQEHSPEEQKLLLALDIVESATSSAKHEFSLSETQLALDHIENFVERAIQVQKNKAEVPLRAAFMTLQNQAARQTYGVRQAQSHQTPLPRIPRYPIRWVQTNKVDEQGYPIFKPVPIPKNTPKKKQWQGNWSSPFHKLDKETLPEAETP